MAETDYTELDDFLAHMQKRWDSGERGSLEDTDLSQRADRVLAEMIPWSKQVAKNVDGTEETAVGGDLFYWPPGHSVRVSADAEIILFSPQAEHCAVVEHLKKQLGG